MVLNNMGDAALEYDTRRVINHVKDVLPLWLQRSFDDLQGFRNKGVHYHCDSVLLLIVRITPCRITFDHSCLFAYISCARGRPAEVSR